MVSYQELQIDIKYKNVISLNIIISINIMNIFFKFE